MAAPARSLLALLAVLTHAAGPVLWASECPCGPACGEVAAEYGCGTACPGCCGEPAEIAGPTCGPDGCGCEVVPPPPVEPALPGSPTTFAPPAAAFAAAFPAIAPADGTGPILSSPVESTAADPPVRVRLCVWRT